MTILNKSRPMISLFATGQDTYSFSFKALGMPYKSTTMFSVGVVLIEPLTGVRNIMTEGTDYEVIVDQIKNETGKIHFLQNPPASGFKILIYSDLDYIQEVAFPENLKIEDALDRLEMQIKQIEGELFSKVGMPYPPLNPALSVTMDDTGVINGRLLAWKVDSANPNNAIITSSGMSVDDIIKAVADAKQAVADAKAAAASAQSSASAAVNAAAAAQNFSANAAVSADRALAAQAAAEAAKNAVEALKTQVEAFAAQVAADKEYVRNFASKLPDLSAGHVRDAIFSDGFGGLQWEYVPELPDPAKMQPTDVVASDGIKYIPRTVPVVVGLTNANVGDTIVVSTDSNGNKQLSAIPTVVTISKEVSTTVPMNEGGVNVELALTALNSRLSSIEADKSIIPWGKDAAIDDYRVMIDGSLIALSGGSHLQSLSVRDVQQEQVGNAEYLTSGMQYLVPAIIRGSNIVVPPCTFFIGFKTAAASADVILVTKGDIIITWHGATTELEMTCGGYSHSFALNVGQWFLAVIVRAGDVVNFYVFSDVNRALVTQEDTGTATSPTGPGGMTVSTNANQRLFALGFLKIAATKTALEDYARGVFNAGNASPNSYVPPPNTGDPGQAPVIVGTNYILKNVITVAGLLQGETLDAEINLSNQFPTGEWLPIAIRKTGVAYEIAPQRLNTVNFINMPAGFSLVNTVDLSTITTDGTYRIAITKDSNANTFTIGVEQMVEKIVVQNLAGTLFRDTVFGAAPEKILSENKERSYFTIQNRLTKAILLSSTSATITTKPHACVVVEVGKLLALNATGEVWIKSIDSTDASGGDGLGIVEYVYVDKN